MNNFTFLDLFSGIGGFRLGLEPLGGVCLGYSEIDKQAIKTYHDNFGKCDSLGDLIGLRRLPNVDLVVGGVPCQPWSNAGLQKGFEDDRGKLWYKVIQLIDVSRPKAFIFENVKGLIDKRNEESYQYIIKSLTNIGYNVRARLINSYDFTGIPQNRNRVFIVGTLGSPYEFPLDYVYDEDRHTGGLSDVFDELKGVPINYNNNNPGNTVSFTDTKISSLVINSWDITYVTDQERLLLQCLQKLRRNKTLTGGKDGGFVYIKTLSNYYQDFTDQDIKNLIRLNILRISPEGDQIELKNSRDIAGINGISRIVLPTSRTFPTLTARGGLDYMATVPVYGDTVAELKSEFLTKVYEPGNYIPLNSIHYKRLQGFPETFKLHPTDRVAKEQLGNAVTMPVITKLGKSLLKHL